ncbi:hypothetical protein, partial [Escherichia coli]|uniref:hypothetical protein n=1 Tax=Escherichia coli TaxID=562 RepID=UPI001CCA7BB0
MQHLPHITVEKVDVLSIQIDPSSLKLNDEVDAAAASQSVPWGIKAIYNDNNLTSTTGGSNVRIAVLDTG